MSIRATLLVLIGLTTVAVPTVQADGNPPFAQFPQNNPPPRQANNVQKGAAVGMAVGTLICVIISSVLSIALAIWMILYVVKDAPKRGMDPTLWAILVFLLGLCGLVIYFMARGPLLSERRRTRGDDDYDDYDDRYDRPRRPRRSVDNDYDDDDDDDRDDYRSRRGRR